MYSNNPFLRERKVVLKYSEKMVSVNLLQGKKTPLPLIPRSNIAIALAAISIMLKS